MLFVKQKTAYDVRISDWSSDVCSSDLCWRPLRRRRNNAAKPCNGNAAELIIRAILWVSGQYPAGAEWGFEYAALTLTERARAGAHRPQSEERCVGKGVVRPGRFRWLRAN